MIFLGKKTNYKAHVILFYGGKTTILWVFLGKLQLHIKSTVTYRWMSFWEVVHYLIPKYRIFHWRIGGGNVPLFLYRHARKYTNYVVECAPTCRGTPFIETLDPPMKWLCWHLKVSDAMSAIDGCSPTCLQLPQYGLHERLFGKQPMIVWHSLCNPLYYKEVTVHVIQCFNNKGLGLHDPIWRQIPKLLRDVYILLLREFSNLIANHLWSTVESGERL